MMQGFTPADRKKARRQLQRSGKLEGKTKAQRQKMIGRRATRIANRAPAGINPVKGLNPVGTDQYKKLPVSGPVDFTGPKGPERKNPPKPLGGMAKGGMASKKGYAKGGMVKANCGASMAPNRKAKK